jgi:hypothetical protein
MMNKMKKIILLVTYLLFFSFISLFKTQLAYAGPRCTPLSLLCISGGNNCNDEGFDCDNYSNLPSDECAEAGGCYENRNCNGAIAHFCYFPFDSPTPPPEECGYIGRPCCGSVDNWSCIEGLKKIDLLECHCVEDVRTIKLLTPTCCNVVTNVDLPSCDPVGQLHIGIRTAFGCFPTNTSDLTNWLLGKAIMFAGAAAFLLMIFGSFQIILSSGDPEKIKKGQEILTAAIAGLLLIIFSVFLLRLIGVTILAIPGWS